MSRDVCGICWCPYDEETGECACKVPSDCAKHQPVAWLFTNLQSGDYDFCYCEDEHNHDREMWHRQPLYLAPPQRKPLTEEEIKECERQALVDGALPFEQRMFFARAIERAHGICE